MQVWNVLHTARWKYRTQKWHKKSPSRHHRTTLLGCIFATKSCIDNRKKLVKQRYLVHMSSLYGELRPTNGWDRFRSLGHPSIFQQVLRLDSVTARHVSQTLRHWTEGAAYIWQGGHHGGHWPTLYLVLIQIALRIPSELTKNIQYSMVQKLFCRYNVTKIAKIAEKHGVLGGTSWILAALASTFHPAVCLGWIVCLWHHNTMAILLILITVLTSFF